MSAKAVVPRYDPANTKSSAGSVAAIALGYFAYLSTANVALRYLEPLAWLVFAVLPFLALLRAARNPAHDTFNAVKTFSVVGAAVVILIVRRWYADTTAIWPTVIVAIFFVNILEAAVSDALRRNWPNLVAGVLLLITIPGPELLHVGSAPPRDVLYDVGWPWILAYTVWNWAFVVNRRPKLAAVHLAVLTAPFLAEIVHPGAWGHSRAFTLGVHQLFSFGVWDQYPRLHVEGHAEALRKLGTTLRVLSLALALAVAAWELAR